MFTNLKYISYLIQYETEINSYKNEMKRLHNIKWVDVTDKDIQNKYFYFNKSGGYVEAKANYIMCYEKYNDIYKAEYDFIYQRSDSPKNFCVYLDSKSDAETAIKTFMKDRQHLNYFIQYTFFECKSDLIGIVFGKCTDVEDKLGYIKVDLKNNKLYDINLFPIPAFRQRHKKDIFFESDIAEINKKLYA